ncbi:ester cyclase [Eudoraea chungangensis]|uniref:ester cyclase n=1 Tax=Eudoraea chungangensis TaxID=1481905 RepID=UPI0023EDDE35|nr:ester cyclase [Eudoraea chungangensis]
MNKALIYIIISVLLFLSCEQDKKTVSEEQRNQLKNQLISYIDTCWNQKKTNRLNPIIAKNFERRLNGISVASNTNELKAHMQVFFMGFPDLVINTRELNIKDNMIFLQWESIGRNTGVYGEMPPTGKKVKINGLTHLYFNEKGEIFKEEVFFNELELLQQLGYTLNSPVLE